MEKARLKLVAELKSLEADYRTYSDPAKMVALKSSVLDDLWGIFGTSVIKPEAAAFTVGRLFQAFEPYREALFCLQRTEELEGKIADLAKAEDEAKKLDQ